MKCRKITSYKTDSYDLPRFKRFFKEQDNFYSFAFLPNAETYREVFQYLWDAFPPRAEPAFSLFVSVYAPFPLLKTTTKKPSCMHSDLFLLRRSRSTCCTVQQLNAEYTKNYDSADENTVTFTVVFDFCLRVTWCFRQRCNVIVLLRRNPSKTRRNPKVHVHKTK